MAIEYENECVGCPPNMGCLGSSCPNRNVPHYYCDNCEEEDDLYWLENKQLCKDCVLKFLEKVE